MNQPIAVDTATIQALPTISQKADCSLKVAEKS